MSARTANEELLDALIRHQTYLLRYAGTVRNKLGKLLNASEKDVVERINAKLANSKGLTTPADWNRMQALLKSLRTIRESAWGTVSEELNKEMVALVAKEPQFFQRILTDVCPVVVDTVIPAARTLQAIVTSQPFEGRLLKDWAANMEADDIRRIQASIQAGMVAGEDSATIARRIVGSAELNGSDGILEMSRRQLEAITHTAVQHIANNARNEFLMANADLFEEEQFVATLDGRTTPQCRALDGKHFPLGKGPRPPLHIRCRSTRVAVMDGAFLGDRPANPTTETQLLEEFTRKNGYPVVTTRDALPHGTKGAYDKFSRARIRELVGPVPASTTYDQWLRRQSTSFQNEILGTKKAQMFRAGLTLDKFVAPSGKEFTLDELAKRYPGL